MPQLVMRRSISHEGFELAAVVDVAGVALFPIDFFVFLNVEDGGDVRLNSDPAVVTPIMGVCQDVFDAAEAFAGVPEETIGKVLHSNAARVYNLN